VPRALRVCDEDLSETPENASSLRGVRHGGSKGLMQEVVDSLRGRREKKMARECKEN